ncbi:MAG: hypothetical protein ACOXZ2_06110 [Sphaerochaetaceae bacterium]|jgi:hypothetical protein|nr:hypothetical protein [Sphaerochaetaceae bacterium]HHU87867.1 hypothetical protein [Spirochaetales bacterium]
MAYCVKCGVKLEGGSQACPLCNTKVVAPPEIIGEEKYPLLVKEEGKIFHPLFDKTRKGIIELVLAFMVIAVITLIITAIAHKGTFSPWLAIISIIFGGLYLLIPLIVKVNYSKIATYYLILSGLLVIGINLLVEPEGWVAIVLLSLGLFWVLAVVPFYFPEGKRYLSLLLSIFSIALYLVLLDALHDNLLSWSLSIGLPTYGVVIVSLGFSAIRIKWGTPTLSDIIISIVLSSCWGVVAGDFFHLRSIHSERFLTWGFSPFIVALLLLIILILAVIFRRVRNFFTNRLT